MIVCSATLHAPEVRALADKLMHFPTWVDLKGRDAIPDTVHQAVLMVDAQADQSWRSQKAGEQLRTDGVHACDRVNDSSREALSEGIKRLKLPLVKRLIDVHNMDQALIFCRTKLDCDNLEQFLMQAGGGKSLVNPYKCACLHADRSPQQRRENLQAFKDAEVRFLICTDVAARGIDISGLPFVINVTLPDKPEVRALFHSQSLCLLSPCLFQSLLLSISPWLCFFLIALARSSFLKRMIPGLHPSYRTCRPCRAHGARVLSGR
jgi:ATP-dependent RNA helicase DDX1